MKICVIVDAGHGATHPITKEYMTDKRWGKYYKFLKPDGSIDFEIREGDVNRTIANKLCKLLDEAGIDYERIYHEYNDTPLETLVRKANKIHQKKANEGFKCILLSFHSNAFGNSPQGLGENPRGFSVWTTRGVTTSDKIASIWFEEQKKICGNMISYRAEMSDGDVDNEENFTIIYGTSCPAVLVENLFFTNKEDAKLLFSQTYQDKSAQAAFNTVQRVMKEVVL